jgi:Skp family chaperone for outer membrane proteins
VLATDGQSIERSKERSNVKYSLVVATIVASLLATNNLFAQQQPPQGAPAQPRTAATAPGSSFVALIDFDHALKGYQRAKYMQDQIRKDKEAAEAAIRKETAEIERDKERLKDFKPSSREYKELEERIAQRVSEVNVHFKIQQRDFAERDQKTLFVLITEITDEVKRYSDAKGIVLVLPYSSDPVDMNSQESMQKSLSKSFVYANAPDITDAVLQELNRRAMQATRQGAGGASSAPKR